MRGVLILLLATAGASARAADCPPPILEGGLFEQGQLDLFAFQNSVQPGGRAHFSFGHMKCCYFWDPVPRDCVTWEVSPPGAAALTLTGEPPLVGGGWLEVDPATPHGTVIVLRASYDQGRVVLEQAFHVYRTEMNPLVGRWREAARVTCPSFIRGDFDGGGGLEITDAIKLFSYQFLGGEKPGCLEAADSNADGKIDLADGVFTLSFLFLEAPPPPRPFPSCGAALGHWRPACEDSGSCPGAGEMTPETPIQEVIFEADGRFSVTWTPFELYKDYWGTYQFDLGTGAITLTITGGNDVPGDFLSLSPTFSREGSTLHLEGIWLGREGLELSRCGYRFETR